MSDRWSGDIESWCRLLLRRAVSVDGVIEEAHHKLDAPALEDKLRRLRLHAQQHRQHLQSVAEAIQGGERDIGERLHDVTIT